MKRLITYTLLGLVVALSFAVVNKPQPAQAQAVAAWNVQYYDNGYLIEPAAVTRMESALAFDWGTGSPANGVHADNFSARFGTDVNFNAGTYRFVARADDEVRVWVDFQVLIDTYNRNAVGQNVSADIALAAGSHHIQVDYREVTGQAYVYVNWANLATNPSGPIIQQPITVPVTPATYTAQYYNNQALSGSPSAIIGENNVSHNWGTGAPFTGNAADNYSVRWTTVQALSAGQYQISVQADDGVRVYVDGQLVIDQWHLASGQVYTATRSLSTGQHNFVIEYFEASGAAFINYNLQQVTTITNVPVVPSGPVATVRAFRLNVRSAPSIVTGAILAKINQNATYAIVGRLADNSWWQLNVNGVVGWASGAFLTVSNAQNVPVIGAEVVNVPSPTGITARTSANLRLRSGPGTGFSTMTVIPRGTVIPIVGRTAFQTWWQVQFSGLTGWVSASYAPLVGSVDVRNIPVTE